MSGHISKIGWHCLFGIVYLGHVGAHATEQREKALKGLWHSARGFIARGWSLRVVEEIAQESESVVLGSFGVELHGPEPAGGDGTRERGTVEGVGCDHMWIAWHREKGVDEVEPGR